MGVRKFVLLGLATLVFTTGIATSAQAGEHYFCYGVPLGTNEICRSPGVVANTELVQGWSPNNGYTCATIQSWTGGGFANIYPWSCGYGAQGGLSSTYGATGYPAVLNGSGAYATFHGYVWYS